VQKHYKLAGQLTARLPTIPSQEKAYQNCRCRRRLPRDRADFAHDPQPRSHELRAQVPNRSGE
jgi:hypothetical protein